MESSKLTKLLREFEEGLKVPEMALEAEIEASYSYEENGLDTFEIESKEFTIEYQVCASRGVIITPATNDDPEDTEYINTQIDVDVLSVTGEDGEVYMTGNQQKAIEDAITSLIELI